MIASSTARPSREAARRADFSRRYGVQRYRLKPGNFDRLFGTLPDRAAADQAKALVLPWGGSRLADPFDHAEIWGRDRQPVFLIGHPYELNGEDFAILAGLKAAGLGTLVHEAGWYGHGSIQVVVHIPAIRDWPTEDVEGIRFTPASPRFDARLHALRWKLDHKARGGHTA